MKLDLDSVMKLIQIANIVAPHLARAIHVEKRPDGTATVEFKAEIDATHTGFVELVDLIQKFKEGQVSLLPPV